MEINCVGESYHLVVRKGLVVEFDSVLKHTDSYWGLKLNNQNAAGISGKMLDKFKELWKEHESNSD